MPLNLFYTMVQKSQKWPKTQIKGGSCLKASRLRDGLFWLRFFGFGFSKLKLEHCSCTGVFEKKKEAK